MNELPRNPDRSEGIYRRPIIIEFTNVVPEKARDRRLLSKLLDERPGILNWALAGLQRLQEQDHFTDSEQTRQALDEYRESNDVERAFVEECCVIDADLKIQAKHFYQAYREWCEANGIRPKPGMEVAVDWRRLGFERQKNSVIYYRAVALKGRRA